MLMNARKSPDIEVACLTNTADLIVVRERGVQDDKKIYVDNVILTAPKFQIDRYL